MKKNSGFKLRSGNKPSIAKFMGLKDAIKGTGIFSHPLTKYGAVNVIRDLFGMNEDNKKTETKKKEETKKSTPEVEALKGLERFKKSA